MGFIKECYIFTGIQNDKDANQEIFSELPFGELIYLKSKIMKKILLLFVLFLGLNVGAFASNSWLITIDHTNGQITVQDDGDYCGSTIVEWDGCDFGDSYVDHGDC